MISRSIFAVACLATPLFAAPPLTTIQDVLFKADGTRFNGSLTISWTSFEAIDHSAIAQQSKTVTVVNGNLQVQLVPTTTATPAAYYTVVYNSDGRDAVPGNVGRALQRAAAAHARRPDRHAARRARIRSRPRCRSPTSSD